MDFNKIMLFLAGFAAGIGLYQLLIVTYTHDLTITGCSWCRWRNRNKNAPHD